MPTLIPFVPSLANYTFSTSLEGIMYTFVVRWNQRDAAWYFDLLDASDTPIASGIKIVLGCYLGSTRSYVQPFRSGVFVVNDTSGAGRDAGFDDLGARITVSRYTLDEVFAATVPTKKLG